MDRLADEARGVDVFEQRRIVRPEAREIRSGRMRADRRAVNAAAQICQVVVKGARQGRGFARQQFPVAQTQGDEGVGVGQRAR